MKPLTATRVAAAIEGAGELSGAMPEEFWAGMIGDKRACEEALRLVVSMTRHQVREALGLNAAASPPEFSADFSVALSDALARIGFRAS